MKNYFYAAAAAFALTAVMTGCTGKKEPVVEVSTPDTSAKLTSENTSETFMAEKTTTSAIKIKITETSDSGNSEPVTTYTVSSEKKETDLSSDKPVVTSKAPRVTEYVEDPEETDVPVITQTAATTVTTAVTEQPTRPVTTRPVPAREDILSAYKEAVEMKIDSMNESGTESFSVSYTLFDMDGNGIPELIVKCGTGEDDYQDTFFTFDGFGIKVISDGNTMKIISQVPAGRVLVDGLGVGDVGSIVLRDRKHLAQDGLIIIVIGIDRTTNEVVAGPDIISRGFVYVRESEELMVEAKLLLTDTLNNCSASELREWNSLKGKLRDSLSDYIYQKTKRSPMILPIIMET